MLCVCHSPCGSVDWNDISVVFSWWIAQSLPLRECGLKLRCITSIGDTAMSLPLRECGLKSISNFCRRVANMVTPLAGVWIEIILSNRFLAFGECHSPCGSVDWNSKGDFTYQRKDVTPLAGVWIEIPCSPCGPCTPVSLPLRECGLKFCLLCRSLSDVVVTPLAGVWIEIPQRSPCAREPCSHSPCGSVDWNR